MISYMINKKRYKTYEYRKSKKGVFNYIAI